MQVRAIVEKELGFADAPSLSAQCDNPNNRKDAGGPRGVAAVSSISATTAASRPRTTYLYILDNRVVGMLSAERVDRGYRLLRNNRDRSRTPQTAVLGVHQLWVHPRKRHSGLARRLLDAARERSVFGLVVPPHRVAFSSPTEAGANFARAYLRQQCRHRRGREHSGANDDDDDDNDALLTDPIVYDCSF